MLSIFIATAEIHSRSVTKEALGASEKVLARPGLGTFLWPLDAGVGTWLRQRRARCESAASPLSKLT
ncbi:hypothetical protein MPL3356_150237 [Mesorhizobium plurifarium]|uniref:Uncharacterized protein n=1 Tax=Mesorhizobium plurifarium TaxID=69974 RepID=A0A090DKR0_MESPL|nr:hypothetical protein MPL3356_150237 [Mesorhizobium plurifarium]